jgi:hypothetical protein
MKPKKSDFVTIALFCGFLFAMTVLYLILPKTEFSQLEKRYLATAPRADWKDIASGDWGEDAESYLADHIPGRDFFVGLNAYFDLYTGRQSGKEIRVFGDRLVEAPLDMDTGAFAAKMNILNGFADTVGQTVNLAIVPSAGWALKGQSGGYFDDGFIRGIYAMAGENLQPVDLLPVFENRPELYYRTDHHWTGEGAFEAYQALMQEFDREFREKADFSIESVEDFQGSTYSRSALWLTPGEPIELWLGSENLTVTNAETEGTHKGVFYRERLEEADKYTVYLDGNHSLVRIVNPEKTGKILVVRDSYANCLGPFLAESYGEVVLVDLRYYANPVSELAAEGFDDILILYSIGNFLTDTNIPRLR